MSIDVCMPESASLIKWHKFEGEKISVGDELFQIETDKTVVDVLADSEGVLQKILVPEGTTDVLADEVVAVIAVPGEEISLNERPDHEVSNADLVADSASAPVSVQSGCASDRAFVSPFARRLAQDADVDLAHVSATGPLGRIVARDVKSVIEARGDREKIHVATVSDNPGVHDGNVEVELDGMRRAIAQRVLESKQTVPHFYLSLDIEVDALIALRRQLGVPNPMGAESPEVKVSINDFIVKAMAIALQRVPAANVSWAGDRIVQFSRSDIGVAIAIDEGLYTPVIRGADTKTLSAISAEIKALIERAARRDLKPADSQGGATTVSNLGMFGVKEFSAIIGPPQATILAVGACEQRVVPKNNQPVIVNAMTVTLSCDHRVVDGAVGARLLSELKSLIERPASMLI